MMNNDGRGRQQSQQVDTASQSKKAQGIYSSDPLSDNPFSKPIFSSHLEESKQPAGALPVFAAANARNGTAQGGADPTSQKLLILAEDTAAFYSIQRNPSQVTDAKAPEFIV